MLTKKQPKNVWSSANPEEREGFRSRRRLPTKKRVARRKLWRSSLMNVEMKLEEVAGATGGERLDFHETGLAADLARFAGLSLQISAPHRVTDELSFSILRRPGRSDFESLDAVDDEDDLDDDGDNEDEEDDNLDDEDEDEVDDDDEDDDLEEGDEVEEEEDEEEA